MGEPGFRELLEGCRAEARRLREDLDAKVGEIEALEKSCAHEWGEDVGHGARPNSTFSLGQSYPLVAYSYWTRACKKCGRVDRTYRSKTVQLQQADWGPEARATNAPASVGVVGGLADCVFKDWTCGPSWISRSEGGVV